MEVRVIAKLALDIYNNLIIKEDITLVASDINILITYVFGIVSTAKIDDVAIEYDVVLAVVKDVVVKILVDLDKYEENKVTIENIDTLLRILIPAAEKSKCGCCNLL